MTYFSHAQPHSLMPDRRGDRITDRLRRVGDVLSKLLLRLLCAALLGIAVSGTAVAAGTSRGTDFWVMFNANYDTPAMTLFITGDMATTGVVTIPGVGFSAAYSVTPGTVTSVVLPSTAHVTALETVGNLGVHIVAGADVSVYGLNRLQFTTDAFLALPVSALGTEYLVMAYANGGSQVGIVAPEDATVVTITPKVAIGGHLPGVPFSVSMSRGQTYQLRNAEMTGTLVTSTKAVAVFGGNQCVNVPASYGYCDHVVEQLPSVNTWGKAFLTVPLASRSNGDTFRILASTDATVVNINGAAVATLNRGAFYERIITGSSQITATQPVLVAQFSNGATFDNTVSDPFMMLIPPYEQFLASYTVTTPATGFSTNFINLVVPTTAVGSLLLDGAAVPSSAFSPIGSSGFSGAQRPVSLGSHRLSAPTVFGVFVYGFATDDSYGYPGGYALGAVVDVRTVTFQPRTSFGLVGDSSCVSATAKNINSLPVSDVRVDFTVTGANPRTGFATANSAGVADFCYVGNNLGVDTIVAAVGTVSDSGTKTWTAMCDVDRNNKVDSADIGLINAGRNSTATVSDPRDANKDGVINILDARLCTLKCTKASCAP